MEFVKEKKCKNICIFFYPVYESIDDFLIIFLMFQAPNSGWGGAAVTVGPGHEPGGGRGGGQQEEERRYEAADGHRQEQGGGW